MISLPSLSLPLSSLSPSPKMPIKLDVYQTCAMKAVHGWQKLLRLDRLRPDPTFKDNQTM